MNLKKLLLGTAGAFVFLLVVNALLFPVFFPDGPPERYENARPAPLFQYHLLAFLISAFLMSYLYPLLSKGGSPWKEGLKVGVIMALFVSLPDAFHVYALVETALLVQLFPALWVCVIWGAGGIVIGLIYGKVEMIERKSA
jgi:hypothetical protein